MKRVFMIILASLTLHGANAQKADPSGIYYLEGVMETASGFKLNTDNSFEYFFSQGALDRTGAGHWKQTGDSITFTSQGKKTEGFILVKSEKKTGGKIQIKLLEENHALAGFVYARLVQVDKTEFIPASDDLSFEWDNKSFSALEFAFEICPDRTYLIHPSQPDDNYFECAIDRTICDVYFEEFTLKFEGASLTGHNPQLKEEEYTYSRSSGDR